MTYPVTWMWFGNEPQLNTNASTPVTGAAANGIEGYTATGKDEIKPVKLVGDTRYIKTDEGWAHAYATTYNGNSYGPSKMTYVSPETNTLTTSQITGFLRVEYELGLPEGETVRQTGVLVQMRNGDMFFRPALDQVDAWDGINALSSVTIIDATPLPKNTYVAKISFKPEIFDMMIVCFAAGTLIATPEGDVAVEDLRPGMAVMTRDAGAQPVRWCGRSVVGRAALATSPNLRPIRIEAGALGAGMPSATLTVSPQHRILVSSAIAQRMFGTSELLVPAKHLTDLPGIAVDDEATQVTYHHLMLEGHHIVTSNGAPTESLYPGRQALEAIGPDAVAEIEALFPGLLDAETPPARPFARGPKVRKLAGRHAANEQALVNA